MIKNSSTYQGISDNPQDEKWDHNLRNYAKEKLRAQAFQDIENGELTQKYIESEKRKENIRLTKLKKWQCFFDIAIDKKALDNFKLLSYHLHPETIEAFQDIFWNILKYLYHFENKKIQSFINRLPLRTRNSLKKLLNSALESSSKEQHTFRAQVIENIKTFWEKTPELSILFQNYQNDFKTKWIQKIAKSGLATTIKKLKEIFDKEHKKALKIKLPEELKESPPEELYSQIANEQVQKALVFATKSIGWCALDAFDHCGHILDGIDINEKNEVTSNINLEKIVNDIAFVFEKKILPILRSTKNTPQNTTT